MDHIILRVGESVKYSSMSLRKESTIRIGVIDAVEGVGSIRVTIFNGSDTVIPALFSSLPLLIEGNVSEVVPVSAVMKNVLILCQRFYSTGNGSINEVTVDSFEGMQDIYAVADTNTRDCFKVPSLMNFASRFQVSHASVGAYEDKTSLKMHLSMTTLIRIMQSTLRVMRINKQKIYTTEECSFSVYFIYYLRNLLLWISTRLTAKKKKPLISFTYPFTTRHCLS